MWAAFGTKSNEIYARGVSKAEVFRKLQRYYPHEIELDFEERKYSRKSYKILEEIYPEPLRILRVTKVRKVR